MVITQQTAKFVTLVLIFLLSFSTYVYTLAPTVALEDSGELITAAQTAGIAHPSGYPLFCFFGKVFSLLPFGDETWTAWKINLMSAFFASVASVLLFLIMTSLSIPPLLAGTAALIGAFSKIAWSQAVIAEVYTLHAALFLGCCYFILRWSQCGHSKWLFSFAFLYGLSLTNHMAMILYAPIFLICFYFVSQRYTASLLSLSLKGAGLFCLGLSFYLYIPLRMGNDIALNYGNIRDLRDVIFHITRGQYSGLDFASVVTLKERLFFSGHFLISVLQQFGPMVGLLGLFGLFSLLNGLLKGHRKKLGVGLGLFLMGSIAIIFIRDFHYTPENIFISRVYFINSYLLFTILIGFGLHGLSQRFTYRWMHPLLALTFLVPLFANFSENNQRNNYLAKVHSETILESLPKDSFLLFINADDFIFPLLYSQRIENVRPDVTVVDAYGSVAREAFGQSLCLRCPKDEAEAKIFKNHVIQTLKEKKVAQHIFFFEPEDFNAKAYSNAGLFYTKEKTVAHRKDFQQMYEKVLSYPISGRHFFENRLLAHYHIRWGEQLYMKGKTQKSLDVFAKAASIAKTDHTIAYRIGRFLTAQREFTSAKQYFNNAIRLYPFFAEAYNGLASIFMKRRMFQEAIPLISKALKLTADNHAPLYFNLGYAHLKLGKIQKGYSLLKKSYQLAPENTFATFHLAKAAEKLGHTHEAIQLYQSLIHQVPSQAERLKRYIGLLKKKSS